MRTEALVDANILIYAYDQSESAKQWHAIALLESLREREQGLVSTQVLSEFYSVVTRKIVIPLTPGDAIERLESFLRSWPVLPVTGAIVLEAAHGAAEHSLHFWDAVLWATARLNQVPLILSEDFAHGSIVGGVTFVNPFREDFRIEDWLG